MRHALALWMLYRLAAEPMAHWASTDPTGPGAIVFQTQQECLDAWMATMPPTAFACEEITLVLYGEPNR